MADNVVDLVETELAELSRRLTEPGQRECLRCFLVRMISEFGCDGSHRWTVRWRDLRAPRALGLVQRLQRRGAVCCDCEVIFNVYPDYPETDQILPCAGVPRAGSAAPAISGRCARARDQRVSGSRMSQGRVSSPLSR